MDSAIICIYLRNSQPPISLKITATSLIRNTLVITLTNLLKLKLSFSPNIFSGSFNASFAAANAFLVIFIISTNCNSSSSSSGGGSDSDSNSASSCVSTKIWTWTSKYKSGAIVVARVAKYNLETSAKKRIVFGQGR